MTGRDVVDISDQVCRLVRDLSPLRQTIGPSTHLVLDAGLDSLALVQLVADVEMAFAISVPDEDVVPENFSTIGQVCSYVLERTGDEWRPRSDVTNS